MFISVGVRSVTGERKRYTEFYEMLSGKEINDIEFEQARYKSTLECRKLFNDLLSFGLSIMALIVGLAAFVFDGLGIGPGKMRFAVHLIYSCIGITAMGLVYLVYAYKRTKDDLMKIEAISNILKHRENEQGNVC